MQAGVISCIVAVVLGQESASEVIPAEFRWATRHTSRLEEELRMAGATQNMYNSGTISPNFSSILIE